MSQDITKNEVNIGEVIYQWTVNEYERHERDRRWYIVMGFICVTLVVYALIAANYLFAMIIVLFAIITFMHDMVEPMEIPFLITNTGIVLGKKYYRYSELENFWMIYDPPAIKNLYFTLNSVVKHRLQVPLEDNDPRPIRDYLNEFLEEDLEQEEEPLSDRYSRVFKL
ncbi:MAG: hypothetical protein Q7S24_00370 [bacterium]|nr:hypothetical protein [bacterium]